MDLMVKVNRALKKAKLSVKELNNGEHTIAEKSFNIFQDGLRVPLTLRAVKDSGGEESRVEIVLWESPNRISGKTISLVEVEAHIPGLDITHPRFEREVCRIKKKSESRKPAFALLYPNK